jgi:hypothetical protein
MIVQTTGRPSQITFGASSSTGVPPTFDPTDSTHVSLATALGIHHMMRR